MVNDHHSLLFIGVIELQLNYEAVYGKLHEIATNKKMLIPDGHPGVMPTCKESKFTLLVGYTWKYRHIHTYYTHIGLHMVI